MPVRRFANDVVAPKVREMDENEMMDPTIVKGLFEQGVRLVGSTGFTGLIVVNSQLMGIEIPSELGGSESSFTSAILTIEELAKIDPSVSVMCDVHNTLVNTVVRKYGTKEQQEKYLPLLAQSKVSLICHCDNLDPNLVWRSLGHSVCQKLCPGQTLLRYRRKRKKKGIIGS
jgi:alkylation response protein AidB-like acyl-CoA dehydrogenase